MNKVPFSIFFYKNIVRRNMICARPAFVMNRIIVTKMLIHRQKLVDIVSRSHRFKAQI